MGDIRPAHFLETRKVLHCIFRQFRAPAGFWQCLAFACRDPQPRWAVRMAKGKAGGSEDEFPEEEEYKESEVSAGRAWGPPRARRVACRSTPQRSPPRWHSPRPQEDVSEEEEDVGRHRKKDKKKKRGKGFIDDAAEEVRALGAPGAAVGRRPRCVGAGGALPTAAGRREAPGQARPGH